MNKEKFVQSIKNAAVVTFFATFVITLVTLSFVLTFTMYNGWFLLLCIPALFIYEFFDNFFEDEN